MTDRTPTARSRRAFLATSGLAGVGALAGCLGGKTDAPATDPVALTGTKQCEVCGMIIEQHPGPTAQFFYGGGGPDHEGPAWFCSAWEGFQYDFQADDRGWTSEGGYVTDYSTVDYEVSTDGGEQFISAHLEPAAFSPVDDVVYVVDSGVKGAMGDDLVPFGEREDADAFAEKYGGEVVGYDAVTPELIGQIGR